MFRTEFLHFPAIDWGEKRVSHNVVMSKVQFRSLELQLYFSRMRGMSPLGEEHRQLGGQRREGGRQEGREGGREAYRKVGRKERVWEGGIQGGRKGGKKSPDLVKETCMAQLSEAAFLLQVYLCPFHTNSLGKLSCCTFIKFGNSLVK